MTKKRATNLDGGAGAGAKRADSREENITRKHQRVTNDCRESTGKAVDRT